MLSYINRGGNSAHSPPSRSSLLRVGLMNGYMGNQGKVTGNPVSWEEGFLSTTDSKAPGTEVIPEATRSLAHPSPFVFFLQ